MRMIGMMTVIRVTAVMKAAFTLKPDFVSTLVMGESTKESQIKAIAIEMAAIVSTHKRVERGVDTGMKVLTNTRTSMCMR